MDREAVECDECGVRLKNRYAVDEHKAKQHSTSITNQQFKCEICNYTTKRKQDLRKHESIKHSHLGEQVCLFAV